MSEEQDQNNSLIDESDNDSEPAVHHQMNPRVEAKINALCQQTGLIMKQENGQRKYTNPQFPGKPEKGTEIFIGKLPRDLFEDELYPVLAEYGPLFELRMMLDFNGNNRGFCFVTYKTKLESQRALKGINNFEIRKGRLLGACQSVDNCRLFVGGIPKNKKKDEIFEEMTKVTEGVVDVIVYPSAADKTKNRGFSFVEYKDHKAAAMARRKLMPGRIQLWGHQIAVDWAEPEIEVDESIMENVKILYVRNLMLHTTEDTLEASFTQHTGKGTIERVKKIRDYAFIHFNTRDNALKAMKAMNNSQIDNATIEVVLAKPVDRDNYVRYTRTNERKAAPILQPMQMTNGFQLVYGDPSQVIQPNPTMYTQAPLYYQMPMQSYAAPGLEQQARLNQAQQRKPRGAGGTRPHGGRNYIGRYARREEAFYLLHANQLTPTVAQGQTQPVLQSVTLSPNKTAVQLLEEICKLNSLGSPVYQLHTCQMGGKLLYLSHITVPGLTLAAGWPGHQLYNPNSSISSNNQQMGRNSIMGSRWSITPDEANNIAAENYLALLNIQVSGSTSSASPLNDVSQLNASLPTVSYVLTPTIQLQHQDSPWFVNSS